MHAKLSVTAWVNKPLTVKRLRKLPAITLQQAAAVLGIG
jgi:hypothetical protein